MNIVIGKLSQAQIHTNLEFIRHQDRLSEIFSDKTLDIKSCFAVADGCLQVTYEKKGELFRSNRRSQMVINSSVTSKARIQLDMALRKLLANGCTLVYSDTGKYF